MNNNAINKFIEGYSSVNFDQIRFAWNGKHAQDFLDANQSFRTEVKKAVLDSPHKAPVPLLRDLFIEESKWCREAWCASAGFSELAELLVKKGGVEQMDCFLDGMMMSFDTFGACHQMRLSTNEIDDYLDEMQRRLPIEKVRGKAGAL